jgi:hypothetical protein
LNEKRYLYIASARNQDEEVDLEMLATVAIAGVRLFVTVDYPLLANNAIREFVKRMDGIHLYRPSEIIKQFGASP